MPDNDEDDFVESVGGMIDYFMGLRGMEPDDSFALSAAVKDAIRARYDGEAVRIKKKYHTKHPPEVIARIKAEYNGQNASVIMERYGVSRRTIYNYIK